MMVNEMQFKISSALKNLIGKELITDEFVAVFELVKNSFDAHAHNVQIIFENQYDPLNSKLIIVDDGKGMDEYDLKNKWLFVAYSAKQDGTEDSDLGSDYRNKIQSKRIFAGAKGVGRFSCDRLGNYLNLISVKDAPNSKIENLYVDWTVFEEDPKKEFISINVKHKVLKEIPYDIQSGTVLEISGLRDEWNRDKIQRLRYSLEKLISPIPENDSANFSINIIATDESEADDNDREKIIEAKTFSKKSILKRGIVNGEVQNFVFESLGLKTTQIETRIINDGKIIHTLLYDRGQLIYEIKENNPYDISDVNINLYQLNRIAKSDFTRQMGIQPVKFGSVFLYKNGFRIYPFGEEFDDGLGLNRRKQQGYNRFLGTRDLIGTIMILGHNPEFQETTSRDGGLIKNKSFDQLLLYFYEKALRRLERYVVGVIKWGDLIPDKGSGATSPALNPSDVKTEIREIIANLTNMDSIVYLNYDENFLDILENRQEKSATTIVKNILRMAETSGDPKFQKDAKVLDTHLTSLLSAKNEAENEVNIEKGAKESIKKELDSKSNELIAEKEKTEIVETQLKKKTEQLKIVTALSSQDIELVTNLHHHVYVVSDNLKSIISIFSKKNRKGNLSQSEVDQFIQDISFENEKIRTISKFGFKKIFEDVISKNNNDLIDFLRSYFSKISTSSGISINYSAASDFMWNTKFSPLDLSIIIDNMISNARKANASQITVSVLDFSMDYLTLSFKNNGLPFSRDINNTDDIFEQGFSTTNSTGLGLFHIKNIVAENNWEISINDECQDVEFFLKIYNNR